MRNPVLFLVGPTGSGKTELSLRLAKRLGCEIISADSMLVYRGMDIGTAKPTPAQRRRVRHHLIDLVLPRKNFSIYLYRRAALGAIREILKRGRIPLVVGGSGLYLEALWKGLSEPLGKSAKLRKKLERSADSRGISFLYGELKKIDPLRAREIHPNDRRRIIRALEIAKLSGKIPSEWYGKRESLGDLGFSVRAFGVSRERSVLYERINRRVKEMFRQGFLKEVKRLRKSGFSKTAGQALGYREALKYLNCRGASRRRPKCTHQPEGRTHSEAVPLRRQGPPLPLIQIVQKRTRQFAKRQLTWFRREKEIEWVPWSEGEPVSRVCDKIIKKAKEWLGKERF